MDMNIIHIYIYLCSFLPTIMWGEKRNSILFYDHHKFSLLFLKIVYYFLNTPYIA